MGINSSLLFPGTLGGQSAASHTAEAQAFIARTSGLDGTHTTAYYNLIDGLVNDGVFSLFDALYIFATQDSTTAGLNLISTSYPITVHGSPNFTADSGYLAVTGATDYLATAFNPTTATTPNFVQDSAHLSLWSLANATDNNPAIGNGDGGQVGQSHLYIKFGDGNLYARINDSTAAGTALTDSRGHLIGNRSSSSALQVYQNGSSFGTVSQASQTPKNAEMLILQANGASDTTHRLAMASIGGSLGSTDASNFYTRLRTYMTAVGVP